MRSGRLTRSWSFSASPKPDPMNESTLKAAGELCPLARLFQAFHEGKVVERMLQNGLGETSWVSTTANLLGEALYDDRFDPRYWRIAEPPKFVPWEVSEVPVGAVLEHKGTGTRTLIISASSSVAAAFAIALGNGARISTSELLEHFTHAGNPCGKAAQS